MKRILCLLMMLGISAFSMQSEFSENDYKIFLLTLLGKENDQFTVKFVDDKIILHGESKDLARIKNELDSVFSDRNILAHNIGYQLASEGDNQLPESQKYNVSTVKEGVGKLKKFIGNIFEEICLDIKSLFNEKSGAYFEDGKMYSKHFIPSLKRNLEDYRNSILSYFLYKTPGDIACAWDDPEYCLTAPDERINADNLSHVCGLVSQCFDIVIHENGNAQLIVDLARIFEFSHRPHVVLRSNGNSEVIEISVKHLLSHVKQLIAGDVLLRLVNDKNQVKIIPIILQQNLKPKKIVHYFVIDESGSMYTFWPKLVEEFKKYISELREEGEFYLVLFNESVNTYGPFNKKEQLNSIIEKRRPTSNTRLFGALTQVLDEIKREHQSDDVKITLFTDGVNSIGPEYPETAAHVKSALLLMPEEQRPYPLIIGLGNVDGDVLSSLAKNCAGQYCHIDSINKLEILGQYAEKMSHNRTLIKFLSVLNQEIVSEYRVNGHSNRNEIVIPDVVLSFREGASIDVGGQHITLLENALINSAQIEDRIKILTAEALTVAKNQGESIDVRVASLKDLCVELMALGDEAYKLLVENACSKIQRYIQILESARNNTDLENSLPDLLAFMSGVY